MGKIPSGESKVRDATVRVNNLIAEGYKLRENSELGNTPPIYLHEDKNHYDVINEKRKYWEKGKSFLRNTVATAVLSPLGSGGTSIREGYRLWKMSPQMHEDLNKSLEYALPIIAELHPEVALGVGLYYAVSKVIYGFKTGNSEEVLSGFTGLLTHLKKIPHTKKFASSRLKSLEEKVSE